MRAREIIIKPKKLERDTGWRTDDMKPCHAPCLKKTKRTSNGWTWRSLQALDNSGREYVLYARCAEKYNKQQAILTMPSNNGVGSASVVARYENHATHPGIHVHSNCKDNDLEVGSSKLSHLCERFPGSEKKHRRTKPPKNDEFWEWANKFFRIK